MMMTPALQCMYSCPLCGLADVVVYVPVRGADQDLGDWMNRVCIPTVCQSHAMLSPDCHPETLAELKIPASSVGVGFLP